LDTKRTPHRDEGSTASTAVVVGDHLYVANVGDSRAIISKAGKGTFIWKLCAIDENDFAG
jgi:protein phosphatase 1L